MRTLFFIALTIITAATTSFAQQLGPKPPVGIPADATLFNGKWYYVHVENVSWRRAKEKCAGAHGQLAIVPDEETHEFIIQLSKGLALWLGASDEKVEGLWRWVDGSEMAFRAWTGREPAGGKRENFLFLRRRGWEDVANETPIVVGYVCEWKAK